MKTFIKIVLLSFLFFISFSGLSQAQSGKGAYGNAISRRSGSQQTDYITRGLRFNADVCAGINIDPSGDVNVTAGAGYQFSPYVYLGGVIGSPDIHTTALKSLWQLMAVCTLRKNESRQCYLRNWDTCSMRIRIMS